ncbi:hypothetical protein CsSME_00002094 [Camellia sinensis var. sinensis]
MRFSHQNQSILFPLTAKSKIATCSFIITNTRKSMAAETGPPWQGRQTELDKRKPMTDLSCWRKETGDVKKALAREAR